MTINVNDFVKVNDEVFSVLQISSNGLLVHTLGKIYIISRDSVEYVYKNINGFSSGN